jgi:hypothetical protein
MSFSKVSEADAADLGAAAREVVASKVPATKVTDKRRGRVATNTVRRLRAESEHSAPCGAQARSDVAFRARGAARCKQNPILATDGHR